MRAPQPRDQLGHVGRKRCLEVEIAAVAWVLERQPPGVQGLAPEVDVTKVVGTEYVALLADQRMAAQPRLESNLVALARLQTNLDQRRTREALQHPVVADRLLRLRVTRMRLLLNECLLVPDKVVTPHAFSRLGLTIHDGPVNPFRLPI